MAKRSYVTGYFQFQIDGMNCGIVNKVTGGDIEGEVIKIAQAHVYDGMNGMGDPKFPDWEVQLGLAMGLPINDWIENTLQERNVRRKSGELRAANADQKTMHITEFADALITKIVFPGGNADGAKEPSYLTVGFKPENVNHMDGDDKEITAEVNQGQQLWIPNNFVVDIGGAEVPGVVKFDPIEIKQSVVVSPEGGLRIHPIEAGGITWPTIKLTVKESSAKDFNLWVNDFIKGGNTGQPKLKQGQIVYRSPNQQPLLTLDLDNLGIHKYSPAPRVYREDKIATFTVDLHCTKVRAHWGA